MDAKQLENLIKLKEIRVAVFGLGYVGLPLAVALARVGFNIVGADIDKNKLSKLKQGINPLTDVDLGNLNELVNNHKINFAAPNEAAAKSDVKIICVPTPSLNKSPDLTHIRSIAKYIGKHVKRGDLIINESTVGPGMTRKILCTVLETESGLKAGQDFFVVASPERIDPGNSTKLKYIPKVLGGINEISTNLAAIFYGTLVNEVVKVSSLEVAEAVKMLENSFRSINIGFVNDVARFCKVANLDIIEVISAASTKPYGFMPFYPGIGVGGHCIPEDPYYLISRGKDLGINFPSLQEALKSNETMPNHALEILKEKAEEYKLEPPKTKVVVFGLSYKKNVKDTRLSPALTLHDLIQNEGFDIKVYDNMFDQIELKRKSFRIFNPETDECHIAVIGCDHDHILEFDYSKLTNLKFILDGKNTTDRKHVPIVGIGRQLLPEN